MKIKLIIIIFVLLKCGLTFCQCGDCGVMLWSQKIYDSSSKDYRLGSYDLAKKIYYKDSMAIVPTTKIIINEVNGVETWYGEDVYYTFIDFHAKALPHKQLFSLDSTSLNKFPNVTFYQYPAFSKDSFFSRKYSNMDTAIRHTFCFFLENRKKYEKRPNVRDTITYLPDTTIKGIVYKRKQTKKEADTRAGLFKAIIVTYSRCDFPQWMTILNPELDDKGCLLPRLDWMVFLPKPQPTWISQQHDFLPRKLTPEEIAVFDAWAKNALDNPVTEQY